ncbi:class III lanthipeptide [Viridibacillus sp. NPDC096237]
MEQLQVLNLQKLSQNEEMGEGVVAWSPVTLTTLWSTASNNC